MKVCGTKPRTRKRVSAWDQIGRQDCTCALLKLGCQLCQLGATYIKSESRSKCVYCSCTHRMTYFILYTVRSAARCARSIQQLQHCHQYERYSSMPMLCFATRCAATVRATVCESTHNVDAIVMATTNTESLRRSRCPVRFC
jgi:hypothetical protein